MKKFLLDKNGFVVVSFKKKKSSTLLTFDRHLILKIFSFCSYKDVCVFRRVNRFFRDNIYKTHFWDIWTSNRSDLKNAKVCLVYNDENLTKDIKVKGNEEDIYQIAERYINQGDLECMDIVWKDRKPKREIIYISSSFEHSKFCNNIDCYNQFISENDGTEYNYHDRFLDWPDPDEFYSQCHEKLLYKVKNSVLIGAETRKMGIKVLPVEILGKIFGKANNSNILYVCKKFKDIYIKYVMKKSLLVKNIYRACREGYINYLVEYFNISSCSNKRAFREACIGENLDLVLYVSDFYTPNYNDLIFAFRNCSTKVVKFICANNVNLTLSGLLDKVDMQIVKK